MGKPTLDGLLVCCAIACAACNDETGSPSSPITTDPFIGSWACTEELSLMFTSPPGRPGRTTTEMSTVRITAASGVLTASKETDSGAGCKVAFTSNASTATLTEGQTCTTPEGITLTYTSGSATVNGSSMSSTFSFNAAGNIDVGGTPVAATATGTQTSTCSRLTPPPGGGGGTTTGGW
jgi:hypothetical protein